MKASLARVALALVLGPSLLGAAAARAGDVEVRQVHAVYAGHDVWTFHVTLAHADTGWEHYADAWRVVAEDGKEVARRVLYHPHVEEQPFTRSLGGVALAPGTRRVHVEAHDKVHGWSPDRVAVDLERSEGPGFRVERQVPD